MVQKKNTPLILLVLDGLGVAQEGEGNAVSKAKMPSWQGFIRKYPSAVLKPTPKKRGRSVDQASSYSNMGGKGRSTKNEATDLANLLFLSGKRWCLLAEPERVPLSLSLLGEQKLIASSDNYLVKDDEQGPIGLKGFFKISDELIKRVKSGKWDIIIALTPGLESVAREGSMDRTVQALEEMDKRLSKISEAVLEKNGCLMITAANGLAETLIDVKTDTANKTPSDSDLPFVLICQEFEGKTLGFPEAPSGDLSACRSIGTLADITPTMADLLGVDMEFKGTGNNLIRS